MYVCERERGRERVCVCVSKLLLQQEIRKIFVGSGGEEVIFIAEDNGLRFDKVFGQDNRMSLSEMNH